MWIHGNYHAITCSVTTMEFQSIYSSLPHTQKLRLLGLAVKAWAWHSLAWQGEQAWLSCPQTDCIAEPELLFSQFCYPPIISARATLSSERCPLGARPGMTVLKLSFSRSMWLSPVLWINLLFLPQSSQWLKVPWITSFEVPLQSERSAVHFISCIYSLKKYWTLASCPAWDSEAKQCLPSENSLSWKSAQPGEQPIIG